MKKRFFFLSVFSLLTLALMAQIQVSGIVMAQGESNPVIGANVVIKGTTTGTVTDINGKFSLQANANQTIEISFIGYVSQEYKANAMPKTITLVPDNVMLDEVVAIGYGTMRKSDLTGAVTSVSKDDLAKAPVSGIDQALQGRAAGVTVLSNSGQPGQSATVRIRGIGSAIAGNDPLYVVDGVITHDISFLPAAEIQSMEILKDASATAIYGARGANGVILITTVSGGEGKANISFDAYWGIQNRWKKLDLMSADDMVNTKLRLSIMKDGVDGAENYLTYRDGGLGAYIDVLIGKTYKPDGTVKSCSPYFPVNFNYAAQNTDWQDEVFKKNAFMHNYNVRVNGGGKYGHYSFSANYFGQDGTIIGSNYNRLTLRLNTDFNVRKWFVIGEHLSFSTSTSRRAMNNNASPGASILSAALAMAPWDPTHYTDGSVNINGKDLSGQNAASSNFKNVTNPFSMVSESFPDSRNERVVGDIFMEFKPIEGLTIRPSLSVDFNLNRNKTFKNAYEYSSYDQSALNFLSSSMARSCTLLEEVTVTYAKTIGKHSFSAMAGQTWSEYNYYSISGSGANILNPIERNWYLNKTTENRTESSDGVGRSRRLSAVARLFYNYGDRYMATVNFRADASSVFTKQPWGFFPSVSAAWRMSEERWLKEVEWMDNLKLRFGYGRVGNDANLGTASFETTIGSSNSVFYGYPLGVPGEMAYGAAVLTQVNKDGKWETNEQWDAGVDFSFWNGMLSGTVDYFCRNTLDALLYVNAPAQVGNKFAVVKNVGNIRNEGVELTLNHDNTVGKVTYHIGGNISYIKNELTKLNGGNPSYSAYTCIDEGLPLNAFWGYKYLGVYQSDEEAVQHQWQYIGKEGQISQHAGDAKYEDINNDGIIDEKDKTYIGTPFPKFTYGVNLGAEFYGVDIQLFFQGVYGNQIYNALRYRTEGAGDECSLSTTMEDVWVGYSSIIQNALLGMGINYMDLENRDGTVPNPVGSPTNSASSSRFVEDGSYFRLKNMQIGYTFPKRWMQKAKIDRLRLFATASNLFTITKYSGYDPEVAGGVDYGNYPQSRTFTFGLNFDF